MSIICKLWSICIVGGDSIGWRGWLRLLSFRLFIINLGIRGSIDYSLKIGGKYSQRYKDELFIIADNLDVEKSSSIAKDQSRLFLTNDLPIHKSCEWRQGNRSNYAVKKYSLENEAELDTI